MPGSVSSVLRRTNRQKRIDRSKRYVIAAARGHHSVYPNGNDRTGRHRHRHDNLPQHHRAGNHGAGDDLDHTSAGYNKRYDGPAILRGARKHLNDSALFHSGAWNDADNSAVLHAGSGQHA